MINLYTPTKSKMRFQHFFLSVDVFRFGGNNRSSPFFHPMPDAEIKIINCRLDGVKTTITIPITATLNVLKSRIEENMSTKVNEQRLFYMGREIKTGGRTLDSIGIGKHSWHIHLFSTGKKPPSKAKAAAAAKKSAATKKRIAEEVICLDSSDEDAPTPKKAKAKKNKRGSPEVIIM